MKKILCILLVFATVICILASCAGKTEPETNALVNTAFLEKEDAVSAWNTLDFNLVGWTLDTQDDFLFAVFKRYVVRYNAKTNEIDAVVDLGDAPRLWYYVATFSSDGNLCVAQAKDLGDAGETGKVLIDFTKKTAEPTEQEHYPHGADDKNYGLSFGSNEQRYDFHYSNDSVKEIKALKPYPYSSGRFIAMDEKRIGALLPLSKTEAASDVSGYYRFIVIDIEKDKIVQEGFMKAK